MWLPCRFSLVIRQKTDKSSRRTEKLRISGQLSTQEEVKKYSSLQLIEDLFFPFLMEEVVGSYSQNKTDQLPAKLQGGKNSRSVRKSHLKKNVAITLLNAEERVFFETPLEG